MVLREFPIASSVDATPRLPHVVLLGPSEQNASAILFNQHAIEPADKASDHQNRKKRSLLHVTPLQHLQQGRGHLWPLCRQGARNLQDKQLIVQAGLPNAMLYS